MGQQPHQKHHQHQPGHAHHDTDYPATPRSRPAPAVGRIIILFGCRSQCVRASTSRSWASSIHPWGVLFIVRCRFGTGKRLVRFAVLCVCATELQNTLAAVLETASVKSSSQLQSNQLLCVCWVPGITRTMSSLRVTSSASVEEQSA